MAFASSPFHGKFCRIEKNNAVAAYTGGWNINASLDMVDISAQGDSWKTALPGLAGWSGSFSGHFVPGDAVQVAFFNNIIAATAGTKLTDVKFLEDADTNAFVGNIYVTGLSVNASLGDKVTFTVNFQGDGALTHVSNA